jgi:hypothetical protein
LVVTIKRTIEFQCAEKVLQQEANLPHHHGLFRKHPREHIDRASERLKARILANMPSILSDEDKETVKRQVPKASNKIQAVAVARLYVSYPNRSKWTYTGLQGAAVLANDLVGNTYWLKLVDISVR